MGSCYWFLNSSWIVSSLNLYMSDFTGHIHWTSPRLCPVQGTVTPSALSISCSLKQSRDLPHCAGSVSMNAVLLESRQRHPRSQPRAVCKCKSCTPGAKTLRAADGHKALWSEDGKHHSRKDWGIMCLIDSVVSQQLLCGLKAELLLQDHSCWKNYSKFQWKSTWALKFKALQ